MKKYTLEDFEKFEKDDNGRIDEFRNKVKKTHNDSLYAQGYFKAADLAQWYFEEENKND